MSERVITRLAPAKINLTLHVTGQRDDGYHLLDSLVCFADFGDTISVTRAKQNRLEIVGPMAQGLPTDETNLVARAAYFIAPDKPFHIVLDKHLPAAAGIGGGSSDAATTLIAISELLDIPVPTGSEVLGADVPVCLHHSAVRMQGVGEVITQVPPLPDVHGVLINPGVSVATPTIFKALAYKNNPQMGAVGTFKNVTELANWLATQRNDLQNPAIAQNPIIGDVLAALNGALFAAMSGSGATCFGLFASASDAVDAADELTKQHPNWWVQPCQFR